MTEIAADAPPAIPSKGLLARAVGVIVSPKNTYADVVARPRILGALGLVLAIVISVSTTFSSTQRGKELALEQTVRYMESFGMQVTDQIYDRMETQIMNQRPYTTVVGTAVVLPLTAAILAGLILAVYTAILGGDAKFKQVYAVVIYSGFLLALQTLFVYPMFYLKQSMSSPTSLAVFLPFLGETSFVARLVGAVDLFRLWWIVNLAIGVGVLYRKRTSPIVSTLLAVYAVIALIIAAIGTAFSGA
jgi:hypothetical protein